MLACSLKQIYFDKLVSIHSHSLQNIDILLTSRIDIYIRPHKIARLIYFTSFFVDIFINVSTIVEQ